MGQTESIACNIRSLRDSADERNYLVNPLHPNFSLVRFRSPKPLVFVSAVAALGRIRITAALIPTIPTTVPATDMPTIGQIGWC